MPIPRQRRDPQDPQRKTLKGLIAATALMLCTLPAVAQAINGFYRFPAIHQQQVWFTAEGDLWRVGSSGGRAERVTTHAGYETHAAVSPDGRWLAFVGAYEGSPDVHVMPVTGGPPKRLSWFGTRVQVWGWTPAGEVLATAPAASGAPDLQLYAIDPTSGRQRLLPVGQASDGAISADGRTLYFTRGGLRSDNARNYRGGATARLWQIDLSDGSSEARPLISHEANHKRPMPYLDAQGHARVAFLSDRDGRFNLWSVDAAGGDLRQHTRHADFDIRHASLDAGRVVYALGADLHLLDLASGSDRLLDIGLAGDFEHQRTRWLAKPQDFLTETALAPDGERVALTVRGRIATVGPAGLRRAEAPLPPQARCREGQFSHDSKHVFALCDMSPQDEVEVWRLPANGIGAPLQITRGATTQRLRVLPSPDGKWLAHLDKENKLWLTALTPDGAGSTRLIDGAGGLTRESHIAWSPDGRAIAFVRPALPNDHDRLYLHRLGEGNAPGRTEVLTSDRYESRSPAFTPDGKWLYFISDRQFNAAIRHPWGDRNMGPFFDKRGRVYALALQPGLRFPFQARDELNPDKADKPAAPASAAAATSSASAASSSSSARPPKAAASAATAASAPRIALDGLAQRLYEVPAPPGNYTELRTDGKRLYLLERESASDARRSLRTLAIDNNDPRPELFAADVQQVELTPDGKKMMVVRGSGEILLLDAAARLPSELARASVRWTDWPIAVEPRAEWHQMFADAWRMQRDHFYDAGLHGVDWRAVRQRYEPLVERLTDRAELNELLAQMVSELGLLHSQVFTADLRSGSDNIGLAFLGARYEKVEQGFRISAIYRGDPELPSAAAPLAAPGVNARVGDIITAVNGRSTREQPSITPMLRGLASHQVLLELRRADGSTRQIVVTPVDATRENSLRYGDWESARAERALQASDGRIGYLHLRAMGGDDIATFAREFYAHIQRDGLIIDVRGNNGGSIDSWIIEKLLRRAWAFWQARSPADGPAYPNMQQAFRGHLAVLVDEYTYSDGETFAAGVQRLKLGTLIGRRTSGAGVWLSDSNRLLDNGLMRAAESGQFTPEGEWLIEGRGVTPDIEIDNPPRASFDGQDAQLEAAIAHLRQRIGEHPVPRPRPPAFPTPR